MGLRNRPSYLFMTPDDNKKIKHNPPPHPSPDGNKKSHHIGNLINYPQSEGCQGVTE